MKAIIIISAFFCMNLLTYSYWKKTPKTNNANGKTVSNTNVDLLATAIPARLDLIY